MLRAVRISGIIFCASLYSSAGCAELPADKTLLLIQKAANEHLAHQASSAGLQEPLFEVSVAKTTRPIPACARTPEVEAVDTRALNRMRFAVSCPDPDGWRQEFVVRAALSAKVVVAAQAVLPGKTLEKEQLMVERRDISLIGDSLNDVRDAVGLTSKRSLRAGDLLRSSMLAAAVAVKRGDPVRIVARRDQVEVSVSGEAQESGALQDVVRVKNSSSGMVIRARIIAPGTVEPVDLPGEGR
jgi:flagella basal body P-ring formation protein FlgA